MDYRPMNDLPTHVADSGPGYRRFIAGFFGLQAVGGTMCALLGVWLNSYSNATGFGWDKDRVFKFHPLFMTVGLVFLNSKAMLTYRVLRRKPKLPVKIAHGCINLLSLALTITALAVIVKHKNDGGSTHFYTVHSWIGIGAVALFGLQWVMGFLVFLYPGGSPPVRAAALRAHRFFGAAIFCLACVAVLTGVVFLTSYDDNYSKLLWSGRVINAFSMTLVLFGLGVLMLLSVEEFRRPPG